ncbi:MAG: prolipoprotein diacylglyceryl transferase [Planctomycetota bacterium]
MPLASAWLHTIDPYTVKLWDGGPIRWYGLAYLVGFFLAFLLIKRVARVGQSPLEPGRASDLVITLAIGIVVGGRVGYAAFYSPSLFGFTASFPYWNLLDFSGGGMASHGGMIGGCVAAWWFAWRHKLSKLHIVDLLAFGAPLGLFFGRVANFINGELFGRRVSADFPLAVRFPQEAFESPAVYDALITAYGGPLPRNWLDLLQAGDTALRQGALVAVPARHPSQLYAATLEGLIVFAVLAVLWWKPRRAGVIGGAFGVAYALMRLVNENFRQPDAHLGEQALGLTRGQWLSVPLLVAGLTLIVIACVKKTPRLGGWRRAAEPS